MDKPRYTPMSRRRRIYEGKAKVLYEGPEPGTLIQHFKDDATAFNAQKRGTILQKGVLNNRMSEVLFKFLEGEGVATHLVRRLSDRDMLVRACEIVKVEVVTRNLIAGSLAKRFGRPEGEQLPEPVVEHYFKDDALGDPMINDWHIRVLKLATPQELATINETALRVNALLREFLDKRDIVLVDMKLEFGRHHGKMLVADEICPDTCRFWDKATGEKLDKDRFRRDLGGVEDAYQEAARRICSAAA
jgi:phosphoribosylaminoimidazole-succinocarboxamide synthase